jgi:hypothetical protein
MKPKTQINQIYSLYKIYHCNHINLIIDKITNYLLFKNAGYKKSLAFLQGFGSRSWARTSDPLINSQML